MVSTSRLDDLRRKVRDDPGSRYFLGLAEELLRAGERVEALAVLEAGLERRPGQVAATVARARCLIELGRPLEAWSAIEPLLQRDPGHLVAAKLAVEIFLRVGDRERARASLARYAALGAADPDLVGLKRRFAELAAGAAEPPARDADGLREGAAVPGAPSAGARAAGGTSPGAATPAAAATAATVAIEEDREVVTVTLGNLYLLQGHRAEAERIFRRILRDDPDHAAARQALARLVARPGMRTGD